MKTHGLPTGENGITRGVNGLPSFARVEIRLRSKGDILSAACDLQILAGELHGIAGRAHPDEASVILAHHKIRATSKKLRSPK